MKQIKIIYKYSVKSSIFYVTFDQTLIFPYFP